jgi:hypothetical protein
MKPKRHLRHLVNHFDPILIFGHRLQGIEYDKIHAK